MAMIRFSFIMTYYHIAAIFEYRFFNMKLSFLTVFQSKSRKKPLDLLKNFLKGTSQYRHITNESFCLEIEQAFVRIVGKYVLYLCEDETLQNGAQYLNVSRYLKEL